MISSLLFYFFTSLVYSWLLFSSSKSYCNSNSEAYIKEVSLNEVERYSIIHYCNAYNSSAN